MQPVKNKKLTYLLICAVAAVWGIIIYKILFNDAGSDNGPGYKIAKVVHEPYDQYLVKNDTFRLALNYRDPFLGGEFIEPVPKDTGTIAPSPPNLDQAPPPAIDWSIIKYSGYIINPSTKKLVSILIVNDKERMVAEGQTFEGVKLLKNKKDSVLVSWLGKQKYIKQ